MEINQITILKQALLASQSDLLLFRKTGIFKTSWGMYVIIVHNNNKLGKYIASSIHNRKEKKIYSLTTQRERRVFGCIFFILLRS